MTMNAAMLKPILGIRVDRIYATLIDAAHGHSAPTFRRLTC